MSHLNSNNKLEDLRLRAQDALTKGELDLAHFSIQEKHQMEFLIQELQIYQAELEIQNHELRKTQIALEAENKKYITLFDNLPIPALVVNQDGIIQQVNPQCLSFFQRQHQSQILQNSFFSLFSQDSRPWLSDNIKKSTCQQVSCSQQLQADIHTKEVRVQVNISCLPYEYHLDTHKLVTLVDLTVEQERDNIRNTLQSVLEQDLEQVLGLNLSSFDQSKASVLVTDIEHKILYVNKSLEEISGYQLKEIQGKSPKIWRSEYTEKKLIQELEACIKQNTTWIGKITNQKKSGGFWTELRSVQALFNRAGEVTGYISLGMDISDKLAFEQQVQRVGRMEAAYTMLAGLNHEFNNILGSIIGLTEINLAITDENAPTYPNLQQTLIAAQRAETLLQHLRKGQKTPSLALKTKELNTLLISDLPIFRGILSEKIQLKINLCEQSLPIKVDTGYFMQTLVNLLKNARDALKDTQNPRCILKTNLYQEANQKIYAELQVQDNGCGMSEEVKQRLFDPFFSTKPIDVGTGLGMMSVLNFVKEHEGVLDIQSAPQRGSLFIIRLPIQI
ncbi:PAS domain S-box-containing protein [Allopseudospirillum japonicum]|uniref:histidine kinase n=1 Tax=Allopseudospirillum japonicum TaxID=64971 RepID=A0A1H6TZH0_9GAMM|nr:PAS domain-containing sensor histidine kinase [Allopseudospirillum japonicum]SEI83604.1 PAS domain S-box-containing protein [Allopseudospirillum japonicum]